MYNVKGPSKIVAKTRRGLSQKVDNFREKDIKGNKITLNNNNNNSDYIIDGPKPIFQNNNKKVHSHKHTQQENTTVTPQHEEIIKYVNESWNCIHSEFYANSAINSTNSVNGHSSSVLYYEDGPVTGLDNFKPFDVESWWSRRLFTYITSSVNSS